MRIPFAALLMICPLAILATFLTPVPVATTTTFQRTITEAYTTTTFDTSISSTAGYVVVQKPIDIPAEGIGFIAAKGKCSQQLIPLAVISGMQLSLQLSSTNPANVYLIPSATYQTSSNGCELIGQSLVAASNFTNYNLHWIVPADGTLYILLTGANAIVILRNHGSTVSVRELATSTYTQTQTHLDPETTLKVVDNTTTEVKSMSPNPTLLPYESSLVALAFLFVTLALLLGRGGNFDGPFFLHRTKAINHDGQRSNLQWEHDGSRNLPS